MDICCIYPNISYLDIIKIQNEFNKVKQQWLKDLELAGKRL